MDCVYESSIQGFKVKRMGIFSAELAICMVVAMILLVGAFLGWPMYKDNANRTVAQTEMKTLKTGVISYMGMHKSSQPPSNLGDLLAEPALAATDAIDNVDHSAFVQKKNWTTSGDSVLDPWGQPYELTYDASTGKGVISTKGNGKKMEVEF